MKRVSWIVVIGDAILLLLFAYGGEVTHELFYPDSLLLSVLHAALPFTLVWFPTAYVMGVLGDPRASRTVLYLGRAVGSWLIAAPLGIVVRGWMIDRVVVPIVFLEVSYLLGIAFFLGWRIVLLLFFKIRRSNPSKVS